MYRNTSKIFAIAVLALALAAGAAVADVMVVAGNRVQVGTEGDGTADAPLEIVAGGDSGIGTGNAAMLLRNAGDLAFQVDNTTVSGFWNFGNAAGETEFRISRSGTGFSEFTVTSAGHVIANGTDAGFYVAATHLNVPDFVFEADYDLMPLDDLAAFVESRKHLPGIQSASQVEEAGMVDISGLQIKLLQKVEELTLYTIAQQKRIDELQARLDAQ